MKTFWAKPAELEKSWFEVDAENEILGRLASKIATILMGKNKPVYTPTVDTGDYVVVINAEKIAISNAKKLDDKKYYRHSGYLGSLKERTLSEMLARKPEEVIRLAVKRMLPKTRLGRQMLKKLKVYAGAEHPHTAQKPTKLEL